MAAIAAIAAMALTYAATLLSAAGQDGWPVITRQPYVQMVTHESAVVVWRTGRPTFPLVLFGESPDALDKIVAPDQIVQRIDPRADAPVDLPRLHSAEAGTRQFEAHIKGLQPRRTYYYAIYDLLTPLLGGDERHRFQTSPLPGDDQPSRFWVVGDSGDGSVGQHASYQGFLDYLANEPENQRLPVNAYIHVGDMAYTSGTDAQFSANFFGVYRDLLRHTCCWPSMGNHEGTSSKGATGTGPYYDAYVVPTRGEAGGVPSGTEAYYAFDFGNIHWVCLDSHDLDRSPQGAMAQWLKADLEAADAEWLIAFWHHPPYTKGTHDSDRESQLIEMRRHIIPILESAGVDLVLCGHSHTYERSMLIDGAYKTPTTVRDVVLDDGDGDPEGDGAYRKSPDKLPNQGSVAVVAGHGRSARQLYGKSPLMRKTLPVTGSFLLDVDGPVLTGRMLDTSGSVRDTFQIIKDAPVVPERIEHPWQPSGPGIIVTERSPGIRTIEMFPLPGAPDAVVRFEINGDDVTASSPVYTTPIPLAPTDRSVQAKTFWRDGSRISPPTILQIQHSPASNPHLRNLAIPIERGTDDAVEYASGEVDLHGELMRLGNAGDSLAGLRFAGVGVPRDAIIVAAHVTFHSTLGSNLPAMLAIQLEDSPDAAAFESQPFDLSARPRSDSVIEWIAPIWSYHESTNRQRSPNLAKLLQDHCSQPNWTPGNALVLMLEGTGLREAWTFDRDPILSATLSVQYDVRDPLTIAVQQPLRVSPALFPGPDGQVIDGLRILYQRLDTIFNGQQLAYQLETSSSLMPADWRPLTTLEQAELIEDQFTKDPPWTRIQTSFPRDILPPASAHYFRLRILVTEANE